MPLAGDIVRAADVTAASAWTAFTPTLTNATVGNGTLDCAYVQIGKLVVARYRFTLGSTSTVGTNPLFTVPVTALSGLSGAYVAWLRDTSATTNYQAMVSWNGAFLTPYRLIEAQTSVTATTPFTWAVNDIMAFLVYYEAA
jgi:hypothetical protein